MPIKAVKGCICPSMRKTNDLKGHVAAHALRRARSEATLDTRYPVALSELAYAAGADLMHPSSFSQGLRTSKVVFVSSAPSHVIPHKCRETQCSLAASLAPMLFMHACWQSACGHKQVCASYFIKVAISAAVCKSYVVPGAVNQCLSSPTWTVRHKPLLKCEGTCLPVSVSEGAFQAKGDAGSCLTWLPIDHQRLPALCFECCQALQLSHSRPPQISSWLRMRLCCAGACSAKCTFRSSTQPSPSQTTTLAAHGFALRKSSLFHGLTC